VKEGALVSWDTRQQPDGLYAVRLVVVHANQQVETAILQVTVDNTPPDVTLLYPTAGQKIIGSRDRAMVFQARASDTLGLARVEWWLDGSLVGTLTQVPFSLPWQGVAGVHTLFIKGFDRAGNAAVTTPIEFTVE
jgi:hypothetical protein